MARLQPCRNVIVINYVKLDIILGYLKKRDSEKELTVKVFKSSKKAC